VDASAAGNATRYMNSASPSSMAPPPKPTPHARLGTVVYNPVKLLARRRAPGDCRHAVPPPRHKYPERNPGVAEIYLRF
jgi:hypothetical protein